MQGAGTYTGNWLDQGQNWSENKRKKEEEKKKKKKISAVHLVILSVSVCLSVFLSLSLSLTHTHKHTHTQGMCTAVLFIIYEYSMQSNPQYWSPLKNPEYYYQGYFASSL